MSTTLPTVRNTNYAPNSQVKSDDLNDFQDWAIALSAGCHLEKTLLLPSSSAKPDDESIANYRDVDGVSSGFAAGWGSDASSIYRLDLGLPLRAGDRITGITAWFQQADTETAEVEIFEIAPATFGHAQKGPGKVTATGAPGAGSISYSSADSDFPLTILDDRLYYMTVTFPSTTSDFEIMFLGCKIVFDHP